jgi:hypothetical protein
VSAGQFEARNERTTRDLRKQIEQARPSQLNIETAVEEGFRARKWLYQQGKEALWDEF